MKSSRDFVIGFWCGAGAMALLVAMLSVARMWGAV